MLSSFFLNPLMLIGLSAVLIPPIIHLLNRRRYDVVDWGAMQFLQISETTRRRLFLEELLLMLLRMGLIAVLVLAVAGPFLSNTTMAPLGVRANRDVVLVFDGSYSMGWLGPQGTPHDKAKEWAQAFVSDLTPGDSVAILQAKEQVVPVMAEPSHDLERVRRRIDELPPPSGGCDWRSALQRAAAILQRSQRAEREIVVLSDGQRHGWADRASLFRWSLLAGELGLDTTSRARRRPEIQPRYWVVNLAPDRPADPPNWSLTPLETDRLLAPAGRAVTFRTAMDLHGQSVYDPPYRVRLEIDGRFVRDLAVAKAAALNNGRVPFSFSHTFADVGTHLVSVLLQADPPPEQRPGDYRIKDELPGDNRQDFALEVTRTVPVLIVDGRETPPAKGSRDFLREALEARDPTPAVQVRVVPIAAFTPALLTTAAANKGDDLAQRPRVLVLRDVARLTAAQQEAMALFVADGGGVLVTLGPRVAADFYNMQLYQGGKGWLPAHLDGIEGDEAKPEDAARPAPGGSDHPALRLFVQKPKDGQGPARFPQLGAVRFPRWWKLTTPGRNSVGVPIAALRTATAEAPFLVEWIDPQRAGRLLLCAVPLDDSWGTDLIRHGAFVPLAHELIYYLAGARSAEFNIQPGQPLRYRVESADVLADYRLQTPLGQTRPLSSNPADKDAFLAAVDHLPQGTLLRIDGLRETGVYRLHAPSDSVVYYVARRQEASESDLTPCGDDDRAAVARLIANLKYQNERDKLKEDWISSHHRQELWWWLLLGVIALLCGEVWMTRRIVKNR